MLRIRMMVGGLQEAVTAEHLIRQVGSAAKHGLAGVWAAQAFGWDALAALTLAGTAAPGSS